MLLEYIDSHYFSFPFSISYFPLLFIAYRLVVFKLSRKSSDPFFLFFKFIDLDQNADEDNEYLNRKIVGKKMSQSMTRNIDGPKMRSLNKPYASFRK